MVPPPAIRFCRSSHTAPTNLAPRRSRAEPEFQRPPTPPLRIGGGVAAIPPQAPTVGRDVGQATEGEDHPVEPGDAAGCHRHPGQGEPGREEEPDETPEGALDRPSPP